MVWIEDGPAAVALVNHASGPAPAAARAALRALSGDDPARAVAAAPARRYLNAASIDPRRIAGEYASAEGSVVRVRTDAETGQLVTDIPGTPDPDGNGLALHAVAVDRYEIKTGAGVVSLRFLVDGIGPAWGAELGERVLTREPRVRRRKPPS
jgi:hypothetical protein